MLRWGPNNFWCIISFHSSKSIVYCLGQYPWDMFDTANELEAIATNNYRHQNFADISWWGASKILSILSITTIFVLPFDSTARALPHPGPAVGHGVHGGPRPVGQNLEAVQPQDMCLYLLTFFMGSHQILLMDTLPQWQTETNF